MKRAVIDLGHFRENLHARFSGQPAARNAPAMESQHQTGMGAAVVAVAAGGGRNADLESLEPLVEPAYWAVSVKPSITTLTWIEATQMKKVSEQTKQCQCRAFHKRIRMHADWWHSKINIICASWTRLIARSTWTSNIECAVVPYLQDLVGRISTPSHSFMKSRTHLPPTVFRLAGKALFPTRQGQNSWWCPSFLNQTNHSALPLRSACEQHCLLNLILSQSRMGGKKCWCLNVKSPQPLHEVSEMKIYQPPYLRFILDFLSCSKLSTKAIAMHLSPSSMAEVRWYLAPANTCPA